MFQYRAVLVRLRQGDSDRDVARSPLMGRPKVAALRAPAEREGWLAAIGDMRVEQVFDEDLQRYLRMARVGSVGRVKDPDELPPLSEPVLVAMSLVAFSLAGFERVESADFAQSWLVSASSVLGA